MGILGIFKKEKKKAADIKEVSMQDIENWLENFVETSGLDSKISILKRDVASKITRLNELLIELERAKIKEEKVIPDRLKSIFEGNKKAFIEKVNAFIAELNVPEKKEEVDEFLEKMSEKLNVLSEDTQKNYFVLKEFVEDHVRPVTSKIKDIDALISNARAEFDKTKLAKVKEIRAHHKKYNYIMGEIEALNKELEHTLEMKKSEIERKSKFDSKIEQLKDTKAYEEYKQLQQREVALKESVAKTEKEIKDLFAKLEYVLRKRHKLTGHNILEKYASEPVDALVEDASLFVVEELKNIKTGLKDLVQKKEKREEFMSHIESAGEQKIIELRKNIISLRDEFESVVLRLKDNHYERSLKERENWVESVNKNIEAIEKKQQDIEDLIERMNPKYVKQKIKDLLRLIDESVELK